MFDFDEQGAYTYNPFKDMKVDFSKPVPCPETHLQCDDGGYCLPVFVRCNGVYDCPGKEDERGCRDAVCPGYYRCRGSAVCLHPDHVCDQFPQCPQQDDELLCNFTCPVFCVCLGLVFKCSHHVEEISDNPRALNISGSNISLLHLLKFTMLIFLDLSSCRLTSIGQISFVNLHTLILRNNSITAISVRDLSRVPNLKHLRLSHNPVTILFSDEVKPSLSLTDLTSIDLSNVYLPTIDVSVFDAFPNLQSLNLSQSGVMQLLASEDSPLSKLNVLDMQDCDVLEFPPKLFLELGDLTEVHSGTHKLCCSQVLPAEFNPNNCYSPVSEISSCNNLLRSGVYRLFLGMFAVLSVIGNIISLLLRLRGHKAKKESGYSVFVTHLCLSDGLMGVYLVIIGLADRLYENTYLWQDVTWKNSVVCKCAGFMALLSTEMSAFVICLITLDRFVVVRFPFSPIRFQKPSAHVVCCAHWAVIIVVVSVPFFPMYTHWGLYSHTDICIPLPITRSSFAGHDYAFGVMIVLNMILFLAVAMGQAAIYTTIKTNTIASTDSSRKQQDLDIARRLFTIAATDFLCWFPVGLLGLLASTGTAVPGEVNVAMATLVMPLNSAMNPFLYTMNVVLERRRRAKEERIIKRLKAQPDNV